MSFIEELTWRGMLHEMSPGTAEWLKEKPRKGYIGFDPTSDSLHIGNLVPIMTLLHFQRHGHIPVALLGGATGMVGDPSGKSQERKLLSEEEIQHNLVCIRKQLEKFIDFSHGKAVLLNNYEWYKNMSLLEFIRDVGKHISVNYMMAKDSVQKRLDTGMSFTEFTYQLIQGYDFYRLCIDHDCCLQMGGSDQWGNITTGIELIRRKSGREAYALVTRLITKADGSKFGKTESGNVWLDPNKTSPYKFYQFWINTSDDDAGRFIRIFTLLDQDTIKSLEREHQSSPEKRVLQKTLAKEITTLVHSPHLYEEAAQASEVLFGNATIEKIKGLPEKILQEIFEGLPTFHIARTKLEQGISCVDLLSVETSVFPSKSEARRMLQSNGVSINKNKISIGHVVDTSHLLNHKYLLIQKGKKNHYLIIAE